MVERRALSHEVYPGQDDGDRSVAYPSFPVSFTAARTIGRKKNRRFGKMVARARRELRKALVHAAGCTFRFEATVCAARMFEAEDFEGEPRVSVPRSLRGRLVRWTGKAARRA